MNKNRIFQLLASFVLLLSLFSAIKPNDSEVNALVDNTSVSNTLRAGTYESKPEGIDPGHDGYSYVKASTVVDPRSGKTVTQVWSHENALGYGGWTAYVAKGSKTLMVTGNYRSGYTLGVDCRAKSPDPVGCDSIDRLSVYYPNTFTPVLFYDDEYTGSIIDMQGSDWNSVFLTTTGELWYTGRNSGYIFRNNTTQDYQGYSMWHKYVPANGIVKITDVALTDGSLFYIGETATGEKKLYISGDLGSSYNSNTSGNNRYLANNYVDRYQHNLEITNELNSEEPHRLFSQRSTENTLDSDASNWVIVETDKGYLGSGINGDVRRATGIYDKTGNISDGTVTSNLDGRDYMGFKPVMYQEKPASLPEIATQEVPAGEAPVKRLPAKWVYVAQSNGEDYIVSFIGAKGTPIEGKIFTSGYSRYGNVSGTHYDHFRGWDNSNTDWDYDIDGLQNSAPMNYWTTGFFAENDVWGNDNAEIYPGLLSVAVRKTDGSLYQGSEIGAGAGTVPSVSPSGSNTNFGTTCLGSNAWCYSSGVFDIENDEVNKPWFVSTTWDKREEIKRGYTLTLWAGAITVDQDEFLRIAARENSFRHVAAEAQLIFPVITSDSKIRTKETAGAGRTNAQYMQYNYNNNTEANRTNYRVVGEFMLLDQVHIEPPTFAFDGNKNSDGINQNVTNTVDNSYNPYNISIGNIYSRKYTLNSDATPSTNAKIYLDYSVSTYDPDTDTVGTTATLSKTNQDITDSTVNVDLSTLQPGWYEVKANRHYTNADGEKYMSSTEKEIFYVPVEIVMDVTSPLEINSGNLGTKIADSATATIRPDTSLKSNIYIENSSIPTSTLGTETTATVNQETGTASKTTNVTVSSISENNIGVHNIDYRVYHSDGSTATISQQVVVNDGSLVVGEDYIISAEDFTMTYSDYSNADDTLKTLANVKLWEKNAEGKFVTTTDLSGVTVTKDGWTQEEGLSKPITFSIKKKDGTVVDVSKEITGNIDHKPTITFTQNPLKLDAANLANAGILETFVTTADADGDTVELETSPASAEAFVSGTIYKVTYTATDSRGNVTTATRVAIVNDGVITVGTKYLLTADDFNIRVSEVGADDASKKAQVLSLSKPVVYDMDGNVISDTSAILDVKYGTPAYTNTLGEYPIEIIAKDGQTEDVKKAITATVVGGGSPTISGDTFKEINVGSTTYDAFEGITFADDFTDNATLKTNTVVDPVIDKNTAAGIYKVTYQTTDDDGNKSNVFTRVVLVNDGKYVSGTDYIIYATDFYTTVDKADVATVMGDASVQVIRKSDAEVMDNATSVDITYGTPDYQSATSANTYPITFTHKTDKGATIKINAKVYDEGTVIGTTYALYGEGFSITTGEAAAYMDSDHSDIITSAKATAKKLVDNSNGTVEVVTNGIKATPGTYDVVIRVKEEPSVTKTIKVEVTDANTVVGVEYNLSAQNFMITLAQAAAYADSDTADVLGTSGANARAWKRSDNSAATPEVVTNGIKVEPGVYPVEIRVKEEPATKKTVYVTVKGAVTGDDKYLIKADNFKVDLTKGETLPTTASAISTLAKATVIDTQTGKVVTDQTVSVDPSSLANYSDGYHDVKFTLENANGNAEVTVKALIITDDTGTGTDGTDNYAVTADDFFIDKRSSANFDSTKYDSSAELVAFANAVAIDTDTLEVSSKTVVSNPTSYATESAGKYTSTYTIDTTSISTNANVYIYDDTSTIDPESGIVINGENFRISSTNAKILTAETLVEMAKAHAFNIKTDEIYYIEVNATDLLAVKTGISDVYAVKITAKDNAAPVRTIYVTVFGDEGVVTGDGKYLLNAYDFTVDLRKDEPLPTTLADFIKLGKVVVKDTDTGEKVTDLSDLSVSPTTMANYKDGMYEITFTYANSTADAVLKVNAVVLDDTTGEVTIDGVNYAIFAHNFVIDKRTSNASYDDANYDSSADIAGHANAYVVNMETSEIDATKTLEADPSSFVGKGANRYPTTFKITGTTASEEEMANIVVYVMDDDTIVGPDGSAISINALNVTVSNTAALSLVENDLLILAQAHAFDSKTGEEYDLDVDNTHMQAINTGVIGDYPAKLTVVGKDVTATITVTVGGDGVLTGDGKYLLKAYDFVVDLTAGDTLPSTQAEMVTAANASVTRVSDMQPLTDLSELMFVPSTLSGYSDGLYRIDVHYPSDDDSANAEMLIVALIIDDETGKGKVGGVDYLLTADNFVIDKTLPTYDSTNYDTGAELVDLANAIAINKDDKVVDKTQVILSDPTSYVTQTGGTYTSTYSIQGADTPIETSAYVFVIDADSVKGKDGFVINADNFTITSTVAKTLTDQGLLTNSNANAFDRIASLPANLSVTPQHLTAINTGVSGVYPVTLKVDASKTTTKTIYVTVTDDDGVITGDGKYLLQAYDFTVDLTNSGVLPTTKDNFVTQGSAVVTSTTNGVKVANLGSDANFSTDPSTMAGYGDGLYDVTYSYASGTGADAEVIVKVLVIDEDTGTGKIGQVNYAVVAEDIFIDKRTGANYDSTKYDTSDELVALANAVAINADTRELDATKKVISDPTTYATDGAGVYESTYTIDTTSIAAKAQVYIYDDTSTVGSDGVVIVGDGFTITDTVAKTLTAQDIITNGVVSAFNPDTKEVFDVNVDSTDLGEINKGASGVFPVKLTVDNSTTTRTIYVTVTGDDGSITGDGKYLLQAYDFTVDLTNSGVLPTTKANFVTQGSAVVTSTETGVKVANLGSDANFSTDPSTMAGYGDGLYDVTYSYASGTDTDAEVIVKVLVIDEDTGTGKIGEVNYAVVAEDIFIDKRTGSNYDSTKYDTSDELVALASAVAINADTRELDATKKVVSDPTTYATEGAGSYESTYTIDTTSIGATAQVYIYDDTSTVGSDGVVIIGDNFTITDTVAKTLSAADLITKGNVKAFNPDTKEVFDVNVDATNLTAVNTGVTAAYPVKLTVDGSTTTRTITVTVLGDDGSITGDGKYLLQAYDFTVDLTNSGVLPTTKANFVTQGSAVVTNTETGVKVANLGSDANFSTDPSTMAGYSDGLYDVTYIYASGTEADAEVVVKVLVIDEDTGTGKIGQVNYAVVAEDIFIDKRTGSNYDSTKYDTSDELVALANAVAINADTRELDATKKVVSDPTTYATDGAGVYDSTYTIDTTTIDTTAQVYIYDDTSTVGSDGVVIVGDNFTITDTVAKTLTAQELITNGVVSAFNPDTKEVFDVNVDSTDLGEINKGETGVFPVELTVDNSTTTRTINVTVTGNGGSITGDGKYLLQAYGFTVDLTSDGVLPTTKANFVTQGSAVVTSTETGVKVANLGSDANFSTDPSTMAGYSDGLYDVTYSYASGTDADAEVIVKVLVIDEDTGTGKIGQVNYAVVAEDIFIDKRTGSNYDSTKYDTSDELVALASAVAINADTRELDATKKVVSDPTTYATEGAGSYESTYTIDTTSIGATAQVYIYDDTSTVGSDGVVIIGDNFTITGSVAMTLSAADLITKGNVKAFNPDTKEVFDVNVDATNLTAVNTGVTAAYPVKLTVDGSTTTRTITVTVLGDGGSITGDGKYLLQAYGFTVDLTNSGVLPTTKANFVTQGSAVVTNTETGVKVANLGSDANFSTDPSTMAGYSDGLYDVTYIYASGTEADAEVVVKVLVIDEDTGTGKIGQVNYAVTADDIFIDKRTGSNYDSTKYDTSDELVALANAVAINADTRELDATKKVVSDPTTYATKGAGVYDSTYTIDTTSINATAQVYIYDDTSTVGSDGVVIVGNGFTITDTVAKTLTAQELITKGVVSAFNPDTKEVFDVNVDSTDLGEINKGESGVFPVKLTVDNSTTTRTIYVTVTGDDGSITGDGKYLLQAYDFTVDLTAGGVLPTTKANFVTQGSAVVTSTETGVKVANLGSDANFSTNPSTMAGYSDGIHFVTYIYESGTDEAAEVIVKVLVIDEDTGTGKIGQVNYAVVADDIFIDKRTGSNYDSTDYDTSDELVIYANAIAINADTRDFDATKKVVSDPTTYATEGAGVYESTYTIDTTSISAKAHVYIYDDTSTVGSDGVVIVGDNFTITDTVAKTLTEQELITNGVVGAFNPSTNEVFNVNVDATNLTAINNGGTGVYPVKLTVDDSTTTRTIYVTVKGDGGSITGDGKYLLQAYGFTVDLTSDGVLPTTKANFVTQGSAVVTSTTNGVEVANLGSDANFSTDPSTMAGYGDGLYDVTYSYASGTDADAEVIVKVLVIDEDTGTGKIGQVNYAVTADDIFIDKRTGANYDSTKYDTSDELVALANAVAINADTRELDATKKVVSDPTTYATDGAGVYDSTYTIDTTAISAKAQVYIYDDTSTVGSDGVVIVGNGFTITDTVAKTLTAQELITNGVVSAFNPDTKEVFDVNVDSTDLGDINKGETGVFPVELTVDGSTTTRTINVTVTGNGGTITGDGKYLLQAYGFTVDLTSDGVLPTTKANFVTQGSAVVTSTETGVKVANLGSDANFSTDPSTMSGYGDGLYDVTYSYASGTDTDAEVIVKVLVIDEDTGTGKIGQVNYAVTADDIFIDKRTGANYDSTKYDTSDELVALANAVAINADTRELDATKKVVSEPTTYATDGAGVYESTYTIDTTSISAKAQVYIYDDTSTVGSDGVVIVGNGFNVTDTVAKTLTAQDIITNGVVSAFNPNTKEVFDVNVDPTDVGAINTGATGVYPVKLTVDDSTTTRTIYVTVKGDDGSITGDGKYLLQAYDFTVDLTNSGVLPTTKANFVTQGSAVVTNTETGVKVANLGSDANFSTDPSTMAGYGDGLYDVTYSYASGTGADAEVIVKVLVIDEDTGTGKIGQVNYAVTADDIFIDKRTGANYDSTKYDTSDELVALANAVAINADTRELDATKKVVSDPTTYATKGAGVYDSTYTIDTTSIDTTAQVYIYDDTSTVGSDGVVIVGNGFNVTDTEAQTLTAQDIITNGVVSAFNPDTKEVFDVNVDPTDVGAINIGGTGVYPVKLTVDDSTTTRTIYVTVKGDDGSITGDGKYLLQAYGFTVDLTNSGVLPTTKANFVTQGSAVVTSTETGVKVANLGSDANFSTSPSTMAGYSDGLYDVTYSYASGTDTDAEVIVKVLVIDEDTGTDKIGDVDYHATADLFVIDKRSSNTLYSDADYDDADDITGHANAKAIIAETREVDETKAIKPSVTDFTTHTAGKYLVDYTIDPTAINTNSYVVVIDDTSTVGNDGVVINGKDFTIPGEDAKLLTAVDFIKPEYGNVTAFNMNTYEDLEVIISTSDLAAINSGIKGQYNVTVSVEGSDTTKVIKVTVIGESEYELSGKGGLVHKDAIDTVDLVEVFDLAVNQVYNGTTTVDYDVNDAVFKLDGMDIPSNLEPGMYMIEVTLGDLKTILPLAIFDDTSVIANDKILFVDEFYLKYEDTEAKGMTFEDLVRDANARAYNIDTGEKLPIRTLTQDRVDDISNGKVGKYEVSVKVNPEAMITVEVVSTSIAETGSIDYLFYIIAVLFLLLTSKFVIKRLRK